MPEHSVSAPWGRLLVVFWQGGAGGRDWNIQGCLDGPVGGIHLPGNRGDGGADVVLTSVEVADRLLTVGLFAS